MYQRQNKTDTDGRTLTEDIQHEARHDGITLRAVLIGMVFLIATTWVAQYSYHQQIQASFDTGTMPSGQGLSIVVIVALCGLALSRWLKRFVRFSPGELAVIYIMLALGGSLMGIGLVSFMVSTIPAFNVSLGNPTVAKNMQGFYSISSPLVFIKDEMSAMAYFAGLEGIGLERIPWRHWIPPVLTWTLFYTLFFFVFICITTVIRKEWAVHQHLTYPIAVPVVDVVNSLGSKSEQNKNSIWREKKFWIGVGIVLIVSLTKTINHYSPVIPAIPTGIALGSYFSEPPWSALGEWPAWGIVLNPLVLGITYLLPLNMLFSLWFFGGLAHIYRVIQSAMVWGWDYNFAYRYSAQGSYIVIAIYSLWLVRSQLKRVFLKALFGKDTESDESEPLSYRMAVVGGTIATIAIIAFMSYALPFELVPGIVLLLFFLVCALTFARSRAEAGTFWMMGNPYWLDVTWYKLGSGFIGEQGKYAVSFVTPWSHGTFSGQLASVGDFYKIADETRINKRKLSWLLLLTFVVAVLVGSFFTIKAAHKNGVWMSNDYDYTVIVIWCLNAVGTEAMVPKTASLGMRGTFIAAGAVLTVILMLLKRAFLWWPLEPLALAAAFSSEFIALNWGSIVIVWLVKFIMYRYFGSGAVRKNQPLFTGLLLGYVVYIAVTGFLGINSGWV